MEKGSHDDNVIIVEEMGGSCIGYCVAVFVCGFTV